MKNSKKLNTSNNQVVYISGGISHNPTAAQDFAAAELELKEQGFVEIMNPLAHDKILGVKTSDCVEGGKSRALVLKSDCAFLCDRMPVIYALSSWRSSSGSKAEIFLGKALGLRIVYQRPKKKKSEARVLHANSLRMV
jgi:hypothetical protein